MFPQADSNAKILCISSWLRAELHRSPGETVYTECFGSNFSLPVTSSFHQLKNLTLLFSLNVRESKPIPTPPFWLFWLLCLLPGWGEELLLLLLSTSGFLYLYNTKHDTVKKRGQISNRVKHWAHELVSLGRICRVFLYSHLGQLFSISQLGQMFYYLR